MISGAELHRVFVVLCLLAAPAAQAQTAWGLPQLMQSLAQTPSGTAHFTERQTSPVLSAPLTSTGTLNFVTPYYLRKTTLSPAQEVFTLDHDQVTLTGGSGTHVFQINQDPRIAGMVEAIRSTLTGDLPTLQQFYSVSLSGDSASWQLHLLPKGDALTHFLRAITISGAANHVTVIDTASTDGSDSRMNITPADAP
jgi:Outer membrane lipoprotein carrier protein LolA-like